MSKGEEFVQRYSEALAFLLLPEDREKIAQAIDMAQDGATPQERDNGRAWCSERAGYLRELAQANGEHVPPAIHEAIEELWKMDPQSGE